MDMITVELGQLLGDTATGELADIGRVRAYFSNNVTVAKP